MDIKKVLRESAEGLGFRYNEENTLAVGKKNGFFFIVSHVYASRYERYFKIHTSVCRGGSFPEKKEIKGITQFSKLVRTPKLAGYSLDIPVKEALMDAKRIQNIIEAVNYISEFLSQNSYVSCCEKTGAMEDISTYVLEGRPIILSAASYANESGKLAQKQFELEQKPENIIVGTIGALLGALIGAAILILFSQLGYFVFISGIIMAACAFSGYRLLSGRSSKIGIVVSILVIMVVIYFANRLDWAIFAAQYFKAQGYDYPVTYLFSEIEDVVEMSDYYGQLAMYYITGLVGVIIASISVITHLKVKNTSSKI